MERLNERLLNWASVLDPQTRQQAFQTASLPIVRPYLALMPDAHLGKGATVGSVIPTHEAIIPAAVGVDIGCGMIAVRTQFGAADLPGDRRAVREAIERAIPLSAGARNAEITRAHTQARLDDLEAMADDAGFDPVEYAREWRRQLGTLGSGNHFIEISLDEAGRVWLFLHSGSRGVGNRIAQRHITVAQTRCAAERIALPDRDLAYLTEGTPEFGAYIAELRWAQHYALLNREEMMDRVVTAVSEWTGVTVAEQERINCHHNYTEVEEHFGERLWVSRKGAINAEAGRAGLIPGSMGTRSYVVSGRGNAEALNSAPHGAGRVHSRSSARRTFTVEDLRAAMGDIEYRDTEAFVDEIPAAYKDIDVVMEDAADLVEVRHTLRQIVNVKGD